MNNATKFSAEVRERAVRMVQEGRGEYPSLWKAVAAIAPKIGCTPTTLLSWVKRAQVDGGRRPGVTTHERDEFMALVREVMLLVGAIVFFGSASGFLALW